MSFVACTVVISGVHRGLGNRISNGDFETGDLTGWQAIDCESPGSSYGVELFDVDGDGAQSQAFWTLPETIGDTLLFKKELQLDAGDIYTLSFDIAESNTSSAGYNGGVRHITAWIGDLAVATYSFFDQKGNIPGGAVFRQHVEETFTPTASGLHTFKLTFQRPWLEYAPIRAWADNIVLVPEPATLSMLAFAGLSLLRRRRRGCG